METYPSKNIAITWVEQNTLPMKLFLSLGFAILTALTAQLRIVIPISPVPITGQTFTVLLAGMILGSTFGSVSMLMYLFLGMSGLPFFSGSVAGLAVLKSPTIGYIVGFFIATYIIGQYSNKPLYGIVFGTFTIYLTGTIGLMLVLNLSVINALQVGVLPFVIGDALKALVAGSIALKIKGK